MKILKEKVLTIDNKQYWKKREFISGITYEAEMFWIPYFELRKGKVVQVVDKVPPKFIKTAKLCKEFDLCLDLKHCCYFTWRELTEDFKCPRCKQPASVFVVYLEPCIKRVGLF